MTFRKSSDADTEAASTVDAKFLAFTLDKSHEVGRLLKITEREDASAHRWVAPQRKYRAHAIGCIQLQNGSNLVFGVTEAGEMRHRLKRSIAA